MKVDTAKLNQLIELVSCLIRSHGGGIELVGVTTVVGNQTLDKVTRNALSVARVAVNVCASSRS